MQKNLVSIGLEIHVALITNKKSFAPEKTDEFSWISLGFPGTLPVLNIDAVEKAIQLSKVLNCCINYDYIVFDRKNYFYYDLPRGYQITQYFFPLGKEGHLILSNGKKIRINQVHLEEDSAQQSKQGHEVRLFFGRLGRSIAEIVTEPDFQTYQEVEEFLQILRRLFSFNNISNASYADGEMRVDLNISVRAKESDPLNVKSEVKNLNSLLALKKSINYLTEVQTKALIAGQEINPFTYFWVDKLKRCEVMRKKGEASDYFYIPESNIPPLSIPIDRYEKLTSSLIVDFSSLEEELQNSGLKKSEIDYLLDNYQVYSYVNKLNENLGNIVLSYNWIVNIVSGIIEKFNWNDFPYPEIEKAVLETEKTKKISLKIAKSIIKEILTNNTTFSVAYKKLNVSLISNETTLKNFLKEAFETYKDQIPNLMMNMPKLERLIIGECMKRSKGQADPSLLKKYFDEMIVQFISKK
ncbi:Asp-tRNA(Asn)/Glu-tRNA(Gln) amidotransferase subunit GatB [Candidatus Mycoplasma haematohominis]|uniref:Asp-tRNA(Asn)/Glu-tRNA(Gln) amidotransferase subunit GatB n=1 Tax=Candidatus Mycoplasma haematohominis TaxID=1494318 RepID=UPI001FE87284|nr:Asp-tRNA(Asn)/Glu-tRNA(Gln) amidotransferase subunit GatB [Candidatus Mycoplasma haemohominis]